MFSAYNFGCRDKIVIQHRSKCKFYCKFRSLINELKNITRPQNARPLICPAQFCPALFLPGPQGQKIEIKLASKGRAF